MCVKEIVAEGILKTYGVSQKVKTWMKVHDGSITHGLKAANNMSMGIIGTVMASIGTKMVLKETKAPNWVKSVANTVVISSVFMAYMQASADDFAFFSHGGYKNENENWNNHPDDAWE